jgi:hypothetical protein
MFLRSLLDKLCKYQVLKVKSREDARKVFLLKYRQQWFSKVEFSAKYTYILRQLMDEEGNLI